MNPCFYCFTLTGCRRFRATINAALIIGTCLRGPAPERRYR